MHPRSLLAILYILEFLHVFYRNRMPFKPLRVDGAALVRGDVSNFMYPVVISVYCLFYHYMIIFKYNVAYGSPLVWGLIEP